MSPPSTTRRPASGVALPQPANPPPGPVCPNCQCPVTTATLRVTYAQYFTCQSCQYVFGVRELPTAP